MQLDGDQYRLIVESSPNMIWRAGIDGLCDYFNSTWLEFTGRTTEQEVGQGWAEGVHPEDLNYCLNLYLGAFEKRQRFEMNYRLRRKDGEWRWINDRGVPIYEHDVFKGYIGSCMDVTEKVLGDELRSLAQQDTLTGVFNRHYFYQQAEHEIVRSVRYRQNLCIAMIDIDHFKPINDEYGHITGDEVLRNFSRILEENVRSLDRIGRYGGDEFIILFPNTDQKLAESVIKRVKQALDQPFALAGQISLSPSFSCGYATLHPDETLDSLVNRADQAMYQVKRTRT